MYQMDHAPNVYISTAVEKSSRDTTQQVGTTEAYNKSSWNFDLLVCMCAGSPCSQHEVFGRMKIVIIR